MRALLLTVAILGFSGMALAFPFVGLLTWGWLTLANPHQFIWGAIPIVSFNDIVAAATVLGWLASSWLTLRDPRWLPQHPVSWLLVLFALWLCISQIFSLDPAVSSGPFNQFMRVMVFVLLCGILIDNKVRVQAMLWIITLSLGIFALKGGLFTVITGGGFRVFGPPNTMIEDNNHFGTALTAIIPLFVYLFQTTKDHRIRMGLVGLVVLSVFAVLGTHSRGAFITLLVCGMFYLWKSGRKVLTLSAILLVAVPALLFMPTDWVGRMRTIETLGEVDTFNQREVAWQLNLRIAQDNPITGAGLRVTYGRDFVRRYFGDETMDSRAAHSIYFEILGGTGFVGLAIFVSILIGGWLSFWRVANLARGRAGLEWAEKLGVAGQIGLGTFMIGGAAVSLEMWEGYLMLIVIGTVTHSIVRRQLTKAGETLAPTWRRLSPAYPAAEAATAKAAGDRQLLPGRRSS